MSKVTLPQLAWFGQRDIEFALPENWRVKIYNMPGDSRRALTAEEMRAAIARPTGSPPLRELARGKQQAVILFDDMTRVTHVSELVPFVLEELAAAGLPDGNIRFVCSLGCHAGLDRIAFAKKLGEKVVSRFPVYNHDPFANCVPVGKTQTYGTELCLNAEVMKCDLRIAIGCVVPHPTTGFGGGGKIVLPGVASWDAILHMHTCANKDISRLRGQGVMGMGYYENNPMWHEVQEGARLAKLDFVINTLINSQGETTAVYAGALDAAYGGALREAVTHYRTPKTAGESIVIGNTFAKANEAYLVGLSNSSLALGPEGGDVVVIANAPDGQVTHYLMGPFGETTLAPLCTPLRVSRRVNQMVVYTEYPDIAGERYIEKSAKVTFLNKWDAVIRVLHETHRDGTGVAVYPGIDIQYIA